MSGHTPGLWIIEIENPNDIVSDVYDVEICTMQPVDTGGLKNWNYGDQTKANARLIAAAPELLDALERLMVCFDDGVGEEWNCKELDAARAAISKAKG